jgi:hypothetical protein
MGLAVFVFRVEQVPQTGFVAMAACTAMLMTVYTLFLGWRKSYEERLVTIPESLQSCPFVMGILQKSKTSESLPSLTDAKVGHVDLVN